MWADGRAIKVSVLHFRTEFTLEASLVCGIGAIVVFKELCIM
jgi:hypothetical protein